MNINPFSSNRKMQKNSKLSKQKIITAVFGVILLGFLGYNGFSFIRSQIAIFGEKQAIDDKNTASGQKSSSDASLGYVSIPGASKIKPIVGDYTQPSSIWALVSKTSSIPTDYVPSPISVPDVTVNSAKTDAENSVRTDITAPVKALFDAAATAGNQLMIGSGYRSADLQAYYFNSLASSVGDSAANQSVARPGQSEHQLGLAIDISLASRECYLDTCFADTAAGNWLAANSYKYGFILRYPSDKVAITGYQYEPWHFRYVGIDLATALNDSGLTLDEAWGYLVNGK